MKKIQMVDLRTQYLHIQQKIDQAIAQVIDSSAFIKGPIVQEFEQNLAHHLQVKHVISTGNGTDALQMAFMALHLEPGDEVITTPFTFIATAEVLALLKLKPVFVDVEPDTFNINPRLIEQAITPRTKAIVPVHLFGQCADMEPILQIAQKHHLFVIEDACQAIDAVYTFSDGSQKKAGTMGTIGCTSFFPSKNLGCYGDGGAIFTNDDALATQLRGIANHGMFIRYHHDMIGVNSRLDSIQAAILNVKLPYLKQYTQARQNAATYYNQALENCTSLQTPAVAPYSTHVFHQYTLKLEPSIDRQSLIDKMKTAGIPVMIYYPIPLHLQKAFAFLNGNKGDFPVAESLCESVISLPMHTELDEEQMEYITSHLKKSL